MSDVEVSVFARTDVGMHRSGNEDSFLVADLTAGKIGLGPDVSKHQLGERGSLMIVSDGMGGAAAGEIASEMAVTTMRESLAAMDAATEISDQLRIAAEIANDRIWNYSQENPELSGMGATLTAVLIQGTTAYIAQVGDSRAYLIRRQQIKQLTKDQSLAQMLVDSGAIKPDQMDSVPQNVIMQAMGTQPAVKVAMSAVQLFRNDCLVICSDGLSNKIPPSEIREIVQSFDDLTDACRSLVDKANERGGEDNITVIVARFDGEALYSASDSNSITGSFRALNQGYSSDYFANSSSVTLPEHDLSEEGSEAQQKQITKMLNIADLAGFDAVPASSAQNAESLPARSPETIIDDDFSTKKTAERPAFEDLLNNAASVPDASLSVQSRKPGYLLIFIIALISLLLLGATGFFVYSVYLKKPPAAQPEPPAPDGNQ
ncbi:MAG TPA: Stp1/IreP family PP2C-type Ser/Thr phosphatase [Blastocatellia bacterium]|nr:Stp1/IreP family PP2C-type Ser/Thr phosphatase [Blastocatellia bacterium]